MKVQIRKLAVALAVGFAFSPTVHATPAVLWDLDGGTAAGNEYKVTQIAWNSGNAIIDNAFPAVSTSGNLLAQAAIGGVTDELGQSKGMPSGHTYVYQLFLPITADQTVTNTVNVADDGSASAFFRMYYTTTSSVNNYTGLGFDSGILVASGTPTIQNGNFDINRSTPTTGPNALVAMGQNNTPGSHAAECGVGGIGLNAIGSPCTDSVDLPSIRATSSLTINIDMAFADSAYFKSDFTSLSLDLTIESAGLGLPFGNTTPVNGQVLGVTPDFGTPESGTYDKDNNTGNAGVAFTSRPVNDFGCNGAISCDMQFQSSGTSKPQANVPEPGSLALLSLSLGAVGFVGARRRRKSK